jgi:hypothetical protein
MEHVTFRDLDIDGRILLKVMSYDYVWTTFEWVDVRTIEGIMLTR